MVGVPDYQTYLDHMKKHHADLTPMDEKLFIAIVSTLAIHRKVEI